MLQKQKARIQYSIEPEWVLGQVAYAVYAWENSDPADPGGIDTTIRKRKLGSFSSRELAEKRYPGAVDAGVAGSLKERLRKSAG